MTPLYKRQSLCQAGTKVTLESEIEALKRLSVQFPHNKFYANKLVEYQDRLARGLDLPNEL